MKRLKIGTRGSLLGLRQTALVQKRLKTLHIECDVHIIKTTGDRVTDRQLWEFGGKAAFTKEIQDHLIQEKIDIAVHSMKDVETFLPSEVEIYAMLEREDPRDGFISFEWKTVSNLPRGARVGTCSLRRQAQLLHRRPDLEVTLLRGNIDTRLKKLREGKMEGTFLAIAGLKRMGWGHKVTEIMSIEDMTPSVGQGAIGIECRKDRDDLVEILQRIHHVPTGICVQIERSFLEGVAGDCKTPVGAYACFEGSQEIRFEAFGGTSDGKEIFKKSLLFSSPSACEEARKLGQVYKEWFEEKTCK